VAIQAGSPSLKETQAVQQGNSSPDVQNTMSMHECVGAFIIQRESVLLGKRSAGRASYPNVWDVFGGHIELGEFRHEALARELFEELGILPTRAHHLETVSVQGSTNDASVECYFYVVTAWDGTPANRQPQEHSEIRWFQREEATQLELASPGYRRIIDRICRNAINSY
jgi:8-oxo-dGTP diphosphatase